MTINKEDYSLGDWVNIPELPGNAQITKLEKYEVWTDRLNELSYDEIEPILLTDEILKKNGFYKYQEDEEQWVLDGLGTILLKLDGHFWARITSMPVSIMFVHELQHLLRRLGIREFKVEDDETN